MTFAPFLKAFVATTVLCLGGAAALVASTGADLPAPHVSRSASFNEKAGWLRGVLAGGKCDVLVIGSSMAMNSIDGKQLGGGGARVVNISSFGMNPEDTLDLLKIVTARCRPSRVIMATYQGDFATDMPDEKGIEWPIVRQYLGGGSVAKAYAADFDPYYLLRRSLKTSEHHLTDTYESVAFDATGGVGLDCTKFHVEPKRWDGDQIEHMPTPRPTALAAMRQIAELTRQLGASFTVAVAPLRPRAEAGFYVAERARLWDAVRAAIAPAGGTLLRPAANASFTDREFADYAHLNRCGAERWTRALVDEIHPQRPPPGAS